MWGKQEKTEFRSIYRSIVARGTHSVNYYVRRHLPERSGPQAAGPQITERPFPVLSIAVMQATAPVNDISGNLERVEEFVVRAGGRGAELIVTPELFASGYAPERVRDSDGAAIRAELARLARQHRIAIVGSSVERAGSGLFVCASLFDHRGIELTRYRKAHLFGAEEKRVFTPGDDLPQLVVYRGVTMALGICYDIEFAEFARSAAERGAEMLCIPTAVPATGDIGGATPGLTFNAERLSTLMVPTRALENGLYIAYANHAAPDFTGLSCIASPYGTVLAAAGRGEELLVAEVDGAEVTRARALNTYLDCVRSDLYSRPTTVVHRAAHGSE